ncbi:protein SSUH2 homolog isoform X2 [Lineus longissimus]|uniref:protein SSUH2 homolog isoform X2 n=1 Tax=Lineus longissimus TaxID=88925 RepID=UPI00315C9A8E
MACHAIREKNKRKSQYPQGGYPAGQVPGAQPQYPGNYQNQQAGFGPPGTAYPQGGGGQPQPQGGPGYPQGPPPQGGPGYPQGPPPQGGPGYPQGPPPQGGPGYPPGPGQAPQQQVTYPNRTYEQTQGQVQPQGQPRPQGGGYPQGTPAGGLPPPPAAQRPQQAPGGEQWASAPSYHGSDIPTDDLMDDPNRAAPNPSAPPMEKMDHLSGYENVSFNDAPLAPPSYNEVMSGPPPERPQIKGVTGISAEEAQDALVDFASQQCCYGTGAAKNMSIVNMEGSSAFHYTLETFTEARSTCWAYEPFKGQPIDGSNNGPAPGPWDIQVQQRTKFQDSTMHMEIPHTASVKPCHECGSIGRVRCWRCHGRGRVMCHHCSGSGRETYYEDGHHHHRSCTWCHGSGRNRCHTCFGHGQVPCAICEARGSLKCYIKLTVKWINHLADHIVERTSLPDHLIRNVSGELAFEEELPRVWAINHFPEDSINKASGQLVQQHSGAFPTERILLQRHRVRIIPVNEATYEHKGKTRNFFVYGFEKKVYTADYPDSCCWGCTIL